MGALKTALFPWHLDGTWPLGLYIKSSFSSFHSVLDTDAEWSNPLEYFLPTEEPTVTHSCTDLYTQQTRISGGRTQKSPFKKVPQVILMQPSQHPLLSYSCLMPWLCTVIGWGIERGKTLMPGAHPGASDLIGLVQKSPGDSKMQSRWRTCNQSIEASL